jgi:hypothetical protein
LNKRSGNKLRYRELVTLFAVLASFVSSITCKSTTHPVPTIYYVSTAGSNSNPGTQSQPWRTIQKAASTIVAGDTVIVQAGTYNEIVKTKANGTRDNPLTFKAKGTVWTYGFHIKHDHIIIDGFSFTGYPSGQSWDRSVIYVDTRASYGQILNCRFKDQNDGVYGIYFDHSRRYDPTRESDHFTVRGCTFSNEGRYASRGTPANFIDIHGGEYHTIENNTFRYSCGADALRIHGRGHTIRGNYFTRIEEVSWSSNHADLFQTFGNNGEPGYDILIEKNFAYDCGYSYGTNCQIGMLAAEIREGGDPNKFHNWTIRNNIFAYVSAQLNMYLERIYVYNNVFFRCVQNTEHVLRIPYHPHVGFAHNSKIKNNLFIRCGSDPSSSTQGWYLLEPGINNVEADHNYVAGEGYAKKRGLREPHGVNGGDPKFVKEGGSNASDYAVLPGSPAIDRGQSLVDGGFSEDFSGKTRPQGAGWDIGAYEFSG